MPRRNQRSDNGKLQYALVTFNYVLHLLGAKSLTALSEDLKDPIYEGVDENGISRLYYAMRDHLHNGEVTTDDLLEYDHHIVKLTNEINEKRRDKIVWKYFQYLSLLFTEIYLDRYFRNKHRGRPEQIGILVCNRSRKDADDASSHQAVSLLCRQGWQTERYQQHHPADTQRGTQPSTLGTTAKIKYAGRAVLERRIGRHVPKADYSGD